MHTFEPNNQEPDEDSEGSTVRARTARFFSPSQRVSNLERLSFSMFYTVSHVFTFLNALLYWVVLVPAGHGGFKTPKFPHHHHNTGNTTGIFYDPGKQHTRFLEPLYVVPSCGFILGGTNSSLGKGLFEEDDIKSFSILNIWTITAVIAFVEVVFLNSIRRQSVSWDPF